MRFQGRVFFLIMTALALLPAPASALTLDDCPWVKPEVQLVAHLPEPALDHSISEAELKARASGLGKGGEGETAGLYHAGIKLVIRSDLGAAYDRRQECFWLTKVVVEVSLTERTIFVIKELKSGGCFYNVVLAHERRHQAIDDDVFHTHGEAVVNVLSREIGKMTPWIMVPIEDAAEGQKTLLAKVQAVAEGAVQKIADQRNARETALDTVEEYRRMGSACPPE